MGRANVKQIFSLFFFAHASETLLAKAVGIKTS